ncbi:MAG: LytR family transcriptional regulator [Chloroflexi bacterium]|nr:MAG: LytR family transcriptional regulator [Chloroflexota bacterium]
MAGMKVKLATSWNKIVKSRYLSFGIIGIFLIGVASCTMRQAPLPTLVATAVFDQATPIAQAEPEPEVDSGETLEEDDVVVTETAVTATVNTPQSNDESSPKATRTSRPTKAAAATTTPTSLPQLQPALTVSEPTLVAGEAVETAIPTAVPTFEVPMNTTNVLLLGNDGGTNTDTMMIVSVNRTGPTASIMSLPRDLYVYQPGRKMGRINTAVARGGVELLKQTILYNFGIPIHYYARVDFEGFKEIVDIMDGVDMSVSCGLADWRLKSPELYVEDEDNWEIFTLESGLHHMDGDTALWYARSRRTTSDFDRGRRQQQLLRAMFTQGVDVGLITEFPKLWDTYQDYVETDMDIGRLLQLASLAPAIRENGIQHLYLANRTIPWMTPGGAQVQLPMWEGQNAMKETFSRLYLPPALNMAEGPSIEVEIINATDNPDLAWLAADNLAWHGFVPVFGEDDPDDDAVTALRYYKPNFKGSYDWLISWIFEVRQSQIELVDDKTFEYDYQVIIGNDYDPCRPQLSAPQIYLNP